MKLKNLFLSLAGSAAILSSCTTEETPIQNIVLDLPQTPAAYRTGTDVPTLGRVLFYDRKLSVNNSVSCATCHKQTLAFADNKAFSVGFESKLTTRNSMPIQNIGGSLATDSVIIGFPETVPTFLFWDGRERDLETMVTKPILNHIEMGFNDLTELEEKLATVPYYEDLFQKAYGDGQITKERIAEAIASFVQSITSQQTKFDNVVAGVTQLSALEQKGRSLFTSTYDCNACHQIENPHGYIQAGTFANIGLDEEYTDAGLANVSLNPGDNGKFKIPSLRNVSLTAPYMHDGRFETLDDVLDHYSDGIANNPNLDTRLREMNGAPKVMEIPQGDKTAIIAFLHTLTDYNMITDPKFSDPFKLQ